MSPFFVVAGWRNPRYGVQLQSEDARGMECGGVTTMQLQLGIKTG